MDLPNLEALALVLPLDNAVRIELREGLPMFRAPPQIQERIEELLDKQADGVLSAEDQREIVRYEELDDFLSLVNRLVRNAARVGDPGDALARTA
jgi:hypothetical protein